MKAEHEAGIFKPNWNEACLCGSAKKYKECCWTRLPAFDIGKKYSEAVRAEKLERALIECRADIVQYTIWHKTNTERLLRRDPDPKLLSIDMNALAAYVERLSWLYFHTERNGQWLDVLDRLSTNIKHKRWRRKIAYFRALHYLAPPQDRNKARAELRQAGSITASENDIELLQIYIDLELGDAPFSKRMAYFDRVLAVSNTLSNQLQYRGAKAIQYFLIGDRTAAEDCILEAVSLARAKDAPLNNYEKNLFAKALQTLGMLRESADSQDEAVSLYHDLLLEDNWTPEGKALVYSEIGTCRRMQGDWAGAEESHRTALQLHTNFVDTIHLAESLLHTNQASLAAELIDGVDRETLEGTVLEDYVLTFAAIAIWNEDEPRLIDAKSLLEKQPDSEPYFNDRRLKLRLSIAKILLDGKVSVKAKVDSAPGRGFASLANSMFMVQPNIAGVGINFNAMIDYFLKKKPSQDGS